MKVIIKRIVGVSMAGLIILSGLRYLSNLTERKSSDVKYRSFFEEEKDYDVLYMGTSHVINGFFPMELWYDYGITSYNFGGHNNTMAINCWVIKNALEYSTPQVIIIDCYNVMSKKKTTSHSFDYVHLSMDAFPMTKVKWEAVRDLISENSLVTEKQTWDLWWDFSVYHDRWKELEAVDFEPVYNIEKGAESRIGITESNKTMPSMNIREYTDENIGIDYLRRMVEECQECGIDVLLTYLPYVALGACWGEANLVSEIAQEYGIKYINFLNMDIVDYQTYFYDAGHLNSSGARAVTDFLGEYLNENYFLTDHRKDDKYKNWHDDYVLYTESKIDGIRSQTSLDNYLILLSDKHFDCEVSIGAGTEILTDRRMINLLTNLSYQDDQDMYYALMRCNEGCLLTKDDGRLMLNKVSGTFLDDDWDVAIEVYDRENEEWTDTAFFTVSKSEFVSAVRGENETE